MKLKIVSSDGYGHGTKLLNAETGEECSNHIRSITWTCPKNSRSVATIVIECMEFEGEGELEELSFAKFSYPDPPYPSRQELLVGEIDKSDNHVAEIKREMDANKASLDAAIQRNANLKAEQNGGEIKAAIMLESGKYLVRAARLV